MAFSNNDLGTMANSDIVPIDLGEDPDLEASLGLEAAALVAQEITKSPGDIKFCESCGRRAPKSAGFCSSCGGVLNLDPELSALFKASALTEADVLEHEKEVIYRLTD